MFPDAKSPFENQSQVRDQVTFIARVHSLFVCDLCLQLVLKYSSLHTVCVFIPHVSAEEETKEAETKEA
jgi:hypothetical protein